MEKGKWLGFGFAGSVGAAVGASLCCLGPTLVIAAGGIVTASLGGVFEWFQAWRPVFTALSLGFLGLGYWYVFRTAPNKQDCDARTPSRFHSSSPERSEGGETGVCTPRNPVNRTLLTLMTLVVAVLITAPYWLVWIA